MTEYSATIHHHSIRSARVIRINGTLETAKRRATKEFGDGFLDHEILIREHLNGPQTGGDHFTVARRRIGERNWRA
jgi:hypothetical protein